MAEPIHARIRADLEARIATGEFAPGDKLPSTTKLVEHYREAMSWPTLAPSTVRHAINDLILLRRLVGRQGLGVFVPLPADDSDQ